MKSIRIQRLKSIVDSGQIELKPLTVVIGKNSSGKSTLLRAFPLLKQSLTTRLSSPILWYGDYVDFGSFNNAITKGTPRDKKNIVLSFVLGKVFFSGSLSHHESNDISLSLTLNDKNVTEYVIQIENYGDIKFSLNEDKYILSVNGSALEKSTFIPSIEDSFFPIRLVVQPHQKDYYPLLYGPRNLISILLQDNIITGPGIPSLIFSADSRRHCLTEVKRFLDTPARRRRGSLPSDEELDYSVLEESIVLLLTTIEKHFKESFQNVQYFQPLRSRGDRFYRVQGLNIKEVDSDGNNAPMILYTLGKPQKDSFKKWCTENFGFYYDIENVGDGDESASVIVRSVENGEDFNMTDVGFGYSQIFPIILSIWMSLNKHGYINDRLVAIEQPELHLHPAFQKKILNVFIKLLEARPNYGLSFLIETHSETIVNYLGRLIAEKRIKKEMINLLCCSKKNDSTVFEKMIFTDDGYIENWPIGFFSDED